MGTRVMTQTGSTVMAGLSDINGSGVNEEKVVGSTSNAHSTNNIAKKTKTCQAASSSSFSATGRTQTIGHLTTGASNSSTAVMRTTTIGHIPPTRVPNYAPPGRITRVLWFPSTQPTTSTQGFQPHQLSRWSQDVTPTTPYATWPSQGSGYKTSFN
ncbi:hypothetical protein Q3G72_011712 [Acer saccharum]|nr:hypothetical protein Q3G72_011712 [Acer saccharum]